MLALLLLLVGGAAWAKPGAESFERHYKRALSLYKAEQYEEAIQAFQSAYAVRQLPRLLLNLGQAHRKLGHAKEALGFYEFYLRVEPNPKPEIRTELDGYIAQTRAMLNAAERARNESQAAQEQAAREKVLDEHVLSGEPTPRREVEPAPTQPRPQAPATAPVATAPAATAPAGTAQAPRAPLTPPRATAPAARPALALTPGPAPAPPPKKSKKGLWIGLGVAAGVLLAGGAAAGIFLATRPAGVTTLALENAR